VFTTFGVLNMLFMRSVLIAEQNRVIVGMTATEHGYPRRLKLYMLYVAPAMHRQGIGNAAACGRDRALARHPHHLAASVAGEHNGTTVL
jgi:hypothetical protein